MMKKKVAPIVEPEKKRRLTPKQWGEAEALWEAGDITQADLGKRFGVSPRSIHSHMRSHHIVHGSKAEAHKKKVAEAVFAASVTDATIYATRIKETKEDHYKMSSALARLAWNEILEAKKKLAPVAIAMNNLKALDMAMNVLKKAREERWAVLGLDKNDNIDEDGLPELLISELTAEQVQALRDRDHTEIEDLPSLQSDTQDADVDDSAVEED
jgi:hypothetical protein